MRCHKVTLLVYIKGAWAGVGGVNFKDLTCLRRISVFEKKTFELNITLSSSVTTTINPHEIRGYTRGDDKVGIQTNLPGVK